MHPDLKLGFEVVSSTLLDGMADRDRAYLDRRIREETAGDHGIEDV